MFIPISFFVELLTGFIFFINLILWAYLSPIKEDIQSFSTRIAAWKVCPPHPPGLRLERRLHGSEPCVLPFRRPRRMGRDRSKLILFTRLNFMKLNWATQQYVHYMLICRRDKPPHQKFWCGGKVYALFYLHAFFDASILKRVEFNSKSLLR